MQHVSTRRSLAHQVVLGLGLGLAVLLVAGGLFAPLQSLERIDRLSLDYRFEARGARADLAETGDVVIVAISDRDLEALPDRFPFPRDYYAHLIENLNRAGARVIAFDMTWAQPAEGDSVLREVLRRHDNVVLAAKHRADGVEGAEVIRLERALGNVFEDVTHHVGIVNALKDEDDVIRRYTPAFETGGYLTPAFAFAVYGRLHGLAPLTNVDDTSSTGHFRFHDLEIPRYNRHSFLLDYYGPVGTFRYFPFSQVIDDERFTTAEEALWGEDLNLFDEAAQALFKDKVVLVGSTMAEEHDLHSTPYANPADPDRSKLMHGVEVQATAVQNLLDGHFIQRASPLAQRAALPFLTLATVLGLFFFRRLPVQRAAWLEVVAILLVGGILWLIFQGAVWAFAEHHLLVSFVYPSLAVLVGYVGAGTYQFVAERRQRAFVRNAFSQYVSRSVVNTLLSHPEQIRLGGTRQTLTVFFSDIDGFTTLSEQVPPEQLVELLNEYLDAMTEIVLRHEGTLDKYVGDAVMAFWGAPIPQADHALRGCLTALEMQTRLGLLREDWKARDLPPIKIRCGLNTGPMIVGNMGGRERFDFTVIGDSVNLAARLEGANKQYGSSIMISESTYLAVREEVVVRELDMIQVKGKTQPIRVYELLGTVSTPFTDRQRRSQRRYAAGLAHYRARRWTDAIQAMEEARVLDPECRVAGVYIQRARHFLVEPPPREWDGVFVMKTK